MKKRNGIDERKGITRRDFIVKGSRTVGGLVAAGGMVNLAMPSALQRTGPVSGDGVLLGLYKRGGSLDAESALARACSRIDFSWLTSGDSVFIKVQSHSENPHPAVTSPGALYALVKELRRRGAGRILVGDQGGPGLVRRAPGNQRFGATRDLMQSNGLWSAIKASGAEPWLFDDHRFETGYVEATCDFPESHWKGPLHIAGIVDRVDHIVYLGRMSSHLLAGSSLGLEAAAGWMREDSRFHLHHDAATFHEKLAEANYVREIRERHRLTLSVAEAYLLHQGPDAGTVAPADPLIVVGSKNLANHDAVAAGILAQMTMSTPKASHVRLVHGPLSNRSNLVQLHSVERATGIPWSYDRMDRYTELKPNPTRQGLASNRMLARAYALQGGIPERIEIDVDGLSPAENFKNGLEAYGGSFFHFL